MSEAEQLKLCKQILRSLFHEETNLFDGTLYFTKGAGWISTCDHKELERDVKKVIGNYSE